MSTKREEQFQITLEFTTSGERAVVTATGVKHRFHTHLRGDDLTPEEGLDGTAMYRNAIQPRGARWIPACLVSLTEGRGARVWAQMVAALPALEGPARAALEAAAIERAVNRLADEFDSELRQEAPTLYAHLRDLVDALDAPHGDRSKIAAARAFIAGLRAHDPEAMGQRQLTAAAGFAPALTSQVVRALRARSAA